MCNVCIDNYYLGVYVCMYVYADNTHVQRSVKKKCKPQEFRMLIIEGVSGKRG